MKKWLFLLVVGPIFTGCEQKEDDKIYSAQMCLNTATSATVDTCLAKISGINSSQAYVIRCSAEFIRANITTSTIVTAIENIDHNDSGNTEDPTIEFYNQFSFTTPSSADTAVDNCTASGSEGLKLLSLSAKTATIIKHNVLSGTLDAATIAALNPATANPSDLQSIGEAVLQMKDISCGKGGTLENTEICDNMNNAIAAGGSDAQAIGEAFLNQMKTANN